MSEPAFLLFAGSPTPCAEGASGPDPVERAEQLPERKDASAGRGPNLPSGPAIADAGIDHMVEAFRQIQRRGA